MEEQNAVTRPTVAPTETRNAARDETTYEHPAYGVVTIHKTHGSQMLFGSDMEHQACIEIRVRSAQHVRRLSSDWFHGKQDLVAIKMSFAQWASLLSSMNMGDGVPCTIDHINRDYRPNLPPPDSAAERFKQEHGETMKDAIRELNELEALAENPKIPAGIRSELRAKVQKARQEITSNLGFVETQFNRDVEKRMAKDKIEIDSYIGMIIERTGLNAIGGKAPDALKGVAFTGSMIDNKIVDSDE